MMKISEMIAMLAEVMADHGDKEVVFVNDATGEIRYAMGMTVEGDMVAIDHISYGEKQEIECGIACMEAFGEFLAMMAQGEGGITPSPLRPGRFARVIFLFFG